MKQRLGSYCKLFLIGRGERKVGVTNLGAVENNSRPILLIGPVGQEIVERA